MRLRRGYSVLGRLAALVGALTLVLSMGCGGNDNPTGTSSTQIIGTASSPGNDLSGATVAIYSTLDQWNNGQAVKSAAVVGSGATVTWGLSNNVLPGKYYLDIWKDNDHSGGPSLGDYFGWYGTGSPGRPSMKQFEIVQGQTLDLGNIDVYLLGK